MAPHACSSISSAMHWASSPPGKDTPVPSGWLASTWDSTKSRWARLIWICTAVTGTLNSCWNAAT